MDSRKGLRHYYKGGYKSSSGQQYGRNGYEMTPKYGYYRSSRPQKNSYKPKSNYIRNFQANYSQSTPLRAKPLMKSKPESEDAEEEERKRKVADTANKLRNKIKSWNEESNLNEDSNKLDSDLRQTSVNCDSNCNTIEQLGSECSASSVNSEEKTKRIAHVRSQILTKAKKSMPNLSQSRRNSVRSKIYDVNKETVKDFQKRIQHKLINEIMQMPKESLQNVLNDPKINPIMEVKMAHLVRENKLLIAQKLRALAESKMCTSDSQTKSLLLLNNIDKLIDPVLETDLSVLPCELIKQMENIFQVQFNHRRYSCERELQSTEIGSLNPCINSTSSDDNGEMHCENAGLLQESGINLKLVGEIDSQTHLSNGDIELRTTAEINPVSTSEQSVGVNTSEDNPRAESLSNQFTKDCLSDYECSTDEDENTERIMFPNVKEENSSDSDYITTTPELNGGILNRDRISNMSKRKPTPNLKCISKRRKISDPLSRMSVIVNRSTLLSEEIPEEMDTPNTHLVVSNSNPFNNAVLHQNSQNYEDSSLFSSQPKFLSIGCQTLCELKNVEVQTSNDESRTLYGVPLPNVVRDNSAESLLEEVSFIQNLVNKLNERRFMIFLQLAKDNPCGSFIRDRFIADSFTETLSNGNISLGESLKRFFTENTSKNHNQTLSDVLN